MIKVIKDSEKQKESSKDIQTQKLLYKMRHQSEEEQVATLAKSLGVPYLDTNLVPISRESLSFLTEKESRENNLAIIQKVARSVTAVTADPASENVQEFVARLEEEKNWKIKLFAISKTNMERVWEIYRKIVFSDFIDQMSVNLTGENLSHFEENLSEIISLKNKTTRLSTTEVISLIMSGAYKLGASDVHIEPQEDRFRLRYRIDGILQDVAFLPLNIYRPVLTRIKMISGMKINLKHAAQDGTFEINLGEKNNAPKKIDTRVSVIPGNFGESIVIRLLDPDSINVEVENLGLVGLAYEQIQKQISLPNGMIVTTGPTGSGKTTTLYSILRKLNTQEKKIITVEDPIEYELPGISQSQVDKDKKYDFSSGLRAIVRQDPDIILVGEIRDGETAEIAINAALTGHLVLTTLHTNSACGAVPRLIEMGIKPSLIAPAVNSFIGQRLVRKLCPHCRESYVPAKESIESIKKILSIISPKSKIEIPKNIESLYRPRGCAKCGGLGYKGRIGIFEVFTISKTLEEMILNMGGETELVMAAMEEGMVTMLQDGIIKAVSGITSVDEVKRVTGQGDFLEEIYEKLMSQNLGRGILIKKTHFEKTRENSESFQKFQQFLEKEKISNVLESILATALFFGTGDIHVEPQEKSFKIRFRIDGLLHDVAELPLDDYPALLGKIKMLSGVKTEVRSGVIDSRFTVKLENGINESKQKSIDVRVSIILGGYGETAVLRILNKESTSLDLGKLGIRKENLEKIRKACKKTSGVILVTGPTGSGKTTTLYSIIKEIKNPEMKIISVEDPIEYQLDGILQTPVNEKEGYTFPDALKSLLRQNPDVLMIGEIRDNETGQIAVQASLTGHLVLSTIHTNDATGTIQRISSMEISSSDIASSINAVLAQRLARVLCECKKKRPVTPEEKSKIEEILSEINPLSGIKKPENIEFIYDPVGCEKCNGIGYKGRVPVSEVLLMTREIQDLVSRGATASEIRDMAVREGMLTITQDGILKALEGETTLSEVERVTDL